MKTLLIVAMLFADVAVAQQTNTFCQNIGNQVYCNSNTVPEPNDQILLQSIMHPRPVIISPSPLELQNNLLQFDLWQQRQQLNQMLLDQYRR